MKSNVERLVRPTCPCGWKPPKNLRIEGTILGEYVVYFDCPECGRGLEKRMTLVVG